MSCIHRFLQTFRFHNYIVEQLALVNEGGRFTKPSEGLTPEKQEKSWKKYDHDVS